MTRRTDLVEGVIAAAQRFGVLQVLATGAGLAAKDAIPRPPHWGGFRLVARRVEFWINAGAGRLHDRAEWAFRDGAWHAQRLYP